MSLYPLNRQHLYIAIGIGLVALSVRFAIVAFYPASSLAGGDPVAFWSFAQGIASGQGFHSTVEPWLADRPPLYSYFVAGVVLVFGENRLMVFVLQAIIGAIAASCFYLVTVRIMGTWRGYFAGILFALFPHFLLFTKQILTETIYIPLIVFLLASLILPNSFRSLFVWLSAGILIGLLALVRREAMLPVLVIFVCVAWLRLGVDRQRFTIAMLVTVLIAGLTVLPWLIRNQIVLGSPVLSSSSGYNFLVGNNPNAHGSYTPVPSNWASEFIGLGELERDRKAWELSTGWIRNSPIAFLQLLPAKVGALWGPAYNPVLDGSDLILIPFYMLGFIRLFKHRAGWRIVVSIAVPLILCNLLIGLVFVGGWRYRLAIYPGLLMLAAYGIPERWLAEAKLVLSAFVGVRRSAKIA
ncbi:MAG: glycosyltransferase family 39 protein [Chloroflexi bacterium]|nr:glycosyltransferase family 39 protein [Chloroflexota bacterium]